MYPKALDKVSCLEGLVGIRTACPPDVKPPFFIEDIEGFDTKKLASLAKGSDLKGEAFGKSVISSAAREMMGDVELLINNGYSLNNAVGDMCSSCNLLPVYVQGGGITVTSNIVSKYQTLKITRLTVLTSVTGVRELTIASVSPQGIVTDTKTFMVDLTANVASPLVLNYESLEKKVRIFFTDTTVPVGQVNCPANTSCGCGASSNVTAPVTVSGLLGGIEVATQYGFLPCASVGCSYNTLVCNLIHTTPNIFGLAMLYKVGDV